MSLRPRGEPINQQQQVEGRGSEWERLDRGESRELGEDTEQAMRTKEAREASKGGMVVGELNVKERSPPGRKDTA